MSVKKRIHQINMLRSFMLYIDTAIFKSERSTNLPATFIAILMMKSADDVTAYLNSKSK